MRTIKSLSILAFGLFLFLSPYRANSQSVTISGQATVTPGSQETYTANFNYTVDPYSIVYWSVSGGTIISQNVNPANPPIYCTVQWDSSPGTGSIAIYEDLNSGEAQRNVDIICGQADGGPNRTICYGGSVVIGVPGIAGYSYSWTPTTGLSNPNIAQPTASPTITTTYTVTMSGFNCAATFTSLTVTVNSLPTVTPAGPINYYYQYESPRPITLTSSISGSNQWYKNNILISGANNQTFNNSYDMGNLNPFIGTTTIQYKVLSNNCPSNVVTVNYIPCFSAADYPVTVCTNPCQSVFTNSPYFVQLYAPNLGSGTTSIWWPEAVLGTSPFQINSSGELSLSGSSSYLSDGIYTKSSLSNGTETYMYNVCHVSQYCKTGLEREFNKSTLNDGDKNGNFYKSVFPTPANTFITIKSPDPVNRIEIFNLSGSLEKIQKFNNTVNISINVKDLKPGLYVCKIYTSNTVKTEKLIIMR